MPLRVLFSLSAKLQEQVPEGHLHDAIRLTVVIDQRLGWKNDSCGM